MAPISQETLIPAHKPPSVWCSSARTTDFRDGTASPAILSGQHHRRLQPYPPFGNRCRRLVRHLFHAGHTALQEAEAPLGIYSKFSHDEESAYAGYYQVRLKDYHINVELTATERCGIQRYTFPKAEAAIFLNLKKAMNWDFTNDSHIEVVDSVTIQGYRYSDGWARDQRIYFRTRFSKPFDKVKLDTTAIIKDKQHIGTAVIARFDFHTEEGEQILVNTAISGVSMEGAAKNLQAEVPENDFDKYLAETKANWNRQLGKIEVESNNQDDKVNFYTALYHSMIAPTIYSDVDGAYYGPDKKVHQSDGWVNYSTFSLWDTYRAAHPLFTYTEPERVNDMVNPSSPSLNRTDACPYGTSTGVKPI